MAEDKKQGDVARNEAAAGQVKPTADRSKAELKAAVVRKADLEHGVLEEPEHAADRTSIPGPEYPPADRPPVATTRPDEPIVGSLVTGAGAHEPPDPHARYLTAAKDEQEARDRVQAQEFALWMASRNPSDDRPVTGREDQDQPFEIVSVEEA
jgi:hypothetical protein